VQLNVFIPKNDVYQSKLSSKEMKMTSVTMRELTQEETAFISGGNANSNYEGGRNTGSNRSSSISGSGISYGGQANGVIGNTAAKNQGLGQGDCSNGVAGGLIGGVTSGSPLGFAGSLLGGAIAGGCFKDAGNGNSSNKGGSNCGSGGMGGTCR
jgi:hypothetical protein